MTKAPLSNPLTLRLPLDVLDGAEKVADACDRTRSWVIVRALKRYLAGEGADILAIAEGRKQIANGDFHDMDDVLNEIDLITSRKSHSM